MGVLKRYRRQKDGSKVAYWYLRYWLNKEEKWESVGKVGVVTKGVAQSKLEERKRQIRLGQLDMIGKEIPFLSDFAEEYVTYINDVRQNRSAKRSRQAIDNFSEYFSDKRLSEITPEDIDNYKSIRLKEDARPATVNRELAVIKNLFNLANKWNKFFGNNPVSRSGMLEVHNQIERILNTDEQKRLLEASPMYLKDIITIALNTGMRQGEILGLKWEWINFKENLVLLPQTNTKNKKINKIPINHVLRSLLLELKVKAGGSEFVFPSPKTMDKHLAWVRRSFKTACKKAGIENLRFHDFRHSVATRSVESGIPLHAVSKLLGHSSIRVTERYSHPESSVQDAVKILANFNLHRSQNRSQEDLEKSKTVVTP